MSETTIGIETKSIGTLIDELVTTNIKCYMAQEVIVANTQADIVIQDEATIAAAAQLAQMLNARRSQLIRAIDERLGERDITQTAKTYE
jgi:uncharacterized protein YbcI